MADEEVLAPQGYEAAETISDNNIVEVYQPDSGGIRRNKQETVDIMKIYYRTLPSYTANYLLMSNSVGLPVISSVSQAEVTTAIALSSTNASDIGSLEDKVGQSLNPGDSVTFASVNTGHGDVECYAMNQDLETGDTPTFADINITGLTGTVEARIETNTSNISSNDSDISTLQSRVTSNDSDISTLQGKVGQSLNTTSAVTFATVNTGQGANELYDMNQNVKSSDSPTFADITITGMTGTVESRIEGNASDISTNASDISTLEGNRVVVGSDASLNSVNTDNVAIKIKKFTGTTGATGDARITHGLTYSKILTVSAHALLQGVTSSDIYRNYLSFSDSESDRQSVDYDTTTISLGTSGDTRFYNAPYKVIVFYEA